MQKYIKDFVEFLKTTTERKANIVDVRNLFVIFANTKIKNIDDRRKFKLSFWNVYRGLNRVKF